MSARRVLATGALVVAVAGVGVVEDAQTHADAASARVRGPVAVFTADASSHHLSVAAIRVRGAGCLASEDSLRLRLVSFDPSARHGRGVAVYRCVKP